MLPSLLIPAEFPARKESCRSVRRTRRKSPNGLTRFVHTFAKWFPHFPYFGLPLCSDSHLGAWRIFCAFSLVVSCGLPGACRGADVFRYRRLSPLFCAPLV